MGLKFPLEPVLNQPCIVGTGFLYYWTGTVWDEYGGLTDPDPYDEVYKHRTIITRGYMLGGYKSSVAWKNVNRTAHFTDITVNLGDLLTNGGSYLGGGFSDYHAYVYSADGIVSGSSVNADGFNMATEVGRTHSAGWDLKTARVDCDVLLNPNFTIGYIVGGGSAATDKHNYVTEVMLASGSAPNSPVLGGTNGGLGIFYGELYGWAVKAVSNGGQFTFATEVWTTWATVWASDGQPKGLTSKWNFGYGSDGSYAGTATLGKYNMTTGSKITTIARPGTNGEENWEMGQNWGYQIGAYNGAAQNNEATKVTYPSDTCVAMGSDTMPKGHDGCSSGATASASNYILGGY